MLLHLDAHLLGVGPVLARRFVYPQAAWDENSRSHTSIPIPRALALWYFREIGFFKVDFIFIYFFV